MPKPPGWYCNDSEHPKTINNGFKITPLAIGDDLEANLNGFTYIIPDLRESDSDWKALAAGWWAAISPNLLLAHSGGTQFGGVEIQDASVPEGHKVIYALPTPVTGAIAGGDLPDMNEVTITYSTFEAGRGGPGGVRWGPVPRSSSSGNEITGAYRDLLLTAMDTLAAVTVDSIVCALVKFDHCHGLAKAITEFVVNPVIHTLDSRLFGRGSLQAPHADAIHSVNFTCQRQRDQVHQSPTGLTIFQKRGSAIMSGNTSSDSGPTDPPTLPSRLTSQPDPPLMPPYKWQRRWRQPNRWAGATSIFIQQTTVGTSSLKSEMPETVTNQDNQASK